MACQDPIYTAALQAAAEADAAYERALDQAQERQRARDAAYLAAHNAGASLAVIARDRQISRSRVQQIIERARKT